MTTQDMTLYAIEETLTHLTAAIQMVQASEGGEWKPAEDDVSREEIGLLVSEWLKNARDKRDAVGRFQIHCESMAALAKAEIERLKARMKRFEAAAEQIDAYVASVIMAKGRDKHNKWQNLEGNTITYSLKKCPPSANVSDPAKVPAVFKWIELKMPVATWDELLGLLPDIESRDRVLVSTIEREITIDKRALLTALKVQAAELEKATKQIAAPDAPPLAMIEGAEIAPEKYRVSRD